MTDATFSKEILINLLLEKSERNLEQAKRNAELGYWDLVANRLYYSIFHAVNSMLLCDDIKTGTHKGTSTVFGKHYILTGKFEREDGIFYSRLQTMREIADYRNVFTLTDIEGSILIKQTEELQGRIFSFVRSKLQNN